jgi:hypothetical protein
MTREEKINAMKKRITELYAETGKIPTKSEYNARRANAPFFNSDWAGMSWAELTETLFPGEAGSEAERQRKLELVAQKVREMYEQTGRIPTRGVYNQLCGVAPKFSTRWAKIAWCDFVAQVLPGVQPGWTRRRGGNISRITVPPPPEVPDTTNWSTNGLLVLKSYTDRFGRTHYILR